MNSEERNRYYASREWALKREAVRQRSNNTCERCWRQPMEATHHLTYERTGNELLTDLQAVCDPCHEFLSGKSNIDPRDEEIEDNRVLEMFGSSNRTLGQPHICCPVCHFEYSHIHNVFTRQGGDEGHNAYSGTQIGTGYSGSRRAALVIVFNGECEHSWELIIQQWKGNNFLQYKLIDKLESS